MLFAEGNRAFGSSITKGTGTPLYFVPFKINAYKMPQMIPKAYSLSMTKATLAIYPVSSKMDVDLLKFPLIPYKTTQARIGGNFEKFLHFPFIPHTTEN